MEKVKGVSVTLGRKEYEQRRNQMNFLIIFLLLYKSTDRGFERENVVVKRRRERGKKKLKREVETIVSGPGFFF